MAAHNTVDVGGRVRFSSGPLNRDMKEPIYILHGIDRKDFLHRALNSIQAEWDRVTVINNNYRLFEHEGVKVVQPDLILHCSQMVNLTFRLARKTGCEFFITMHDDAYFTEPWVMTRFIEVCKETFALHPRLAWLGTLYDAVCAYRMAAVDEVGDYDQHIKNYGMDTDYQIRLSLAGWQMWDDFAFRPYLIHENSIKVKEEPAFKICCDIDQGALWAYLHAKWGITYDDVLHSRHLNPPKKRPFV